MSEPRTVAFLLVPGFSLISYACCADALRVANQLAEKPLYRWLQVTSDGKPVMASCGVSLVPDAPMNVELRKLSWLFVCAGDAQDDSVVAWLRRAAGQGISIAGISGGSLPMARAGLLRARRATVHWEHSAEFRDRFPEIRLNSTLFEMDGNRASCPGGVAALDLMVSLIARDHGYALGAAVSDWFLHAAPRDGEERQKGDPRLRVGVCDEKLPRCAGRHGGEPRVSSVVAGAGRDFRTVAEATPAPVSAPIRTGGPRLLSGAAIT